MLLGILNPNYNIELLSIQNPYSVEHLNSKACWTEKFRYRENISRSYRLSVGRSVGSPVTTLNLRPRGPDVLMAPISTDVHRTQYRGVLLSNSDISIIFKGSPTSNSLRLLIDSG